ncbi:MAG: acyl carrier protein [Bacteroidetes bacterium]|jgi:acyl carrier protein|nr:acyl carrier protein [Bacteroidota bacterium]
MRTDIQEKLNTLFRQVFQDNQIEVRADMTAADVASWDSLNHMTMIQAVEKAFGVKFKLKEITKMQNVGDMARLIEEKGA